MLYWDWKIIAFTLLFKTYSSHSVMSPKDKATNYNTLKISGCSLGFINKFVQKASKELMKTCKNFATLFIAALESLEKKCLR